MCVLAPQHSMRYVRMCVSGSNPVLEMFWRAPATVVVGARFFCWGYRGYSVFGVARLRKTENG